MSHVNELTWLGNEVEQKHFEFPSFADTSAGTSASFCFGQSFDSFD